MPREFVTESELEVDELTARFSNHETKSLQKNQHRPEYPALRFKLVAPGYDEPVHQMHEHNGHDGCDCNRQCERPRRGKAGKAVHVANDVESGIDVGRAEQHPSEQDQVKRDCPFQDRQQS